MNSQVELLMPLKYFSCNLNILLPDGRIDILNKPASWKYLQTSFLKTKFYNMINRFQINSSLKIFKINDFVYWEYDKKLKHDFQIIS